MAQAAEPQTRRRYSPRLPREERREQLLDATLRLIAREGFAGMSMEAVAREAQIAKTVVYDAFGTRGDLLKALLEREQVRVLSAIAAAVPTLPLEGDPGAILTRGLADVLEEVRGHPETWRLILLPADGTPRSLRADVERNRQRLLRQMTPVVAWGMERLGLAQLDAELASHTILGAAENAARLVLTDPDRFPPDRLARFAADLMDAIAARN
jgi:AcrR family transcriptional regulator